MVNKNNVNIAAEEKKDRIYELIKNADAVIIGAGSGLSTSAGFVYDGERFNKYFHDFAEKYGFTDMYSGGFYHYKTLEERFAYWSRYIYYNRYVDAPKPVYKELLELVEDKNYFVLTTNVDHCFQKAGFDKERLFYTQGDYGLFQCSKPCHSETYDNEEIILRMMEQQNDMRVPTELIPHCPKCGSIMTMNLRADDTFVEDEGWHEACRRYEKFINDNKDKKILFIELGVGYNTPGIIKYPFWRMTNSFDKSFYVSINYGEAYVPDEIKDKAICIDDDIGKVVSYLIDKAKKVHNSES